MDAYEFSTQVTKTGYVAIPTEYIDQIPHGTDVRVVILVDKPQITTNGKNGHHDELGSLEALIAEIKNNPSKPENIHPASGNLAEHLVNPVTEPDPNFDETAWNQEWANIEARMKAASLAHEQEEIQIILRKQGRQLEAIDSMLAVTALGNDLTLLTTDKDFFAVPNLKQENWLS
jgi:hypothetical protein